jgi:hypothetical protein
MFNIPNGKQPKALGRLWELVFGACNLLFAIKGLGMIRWRLPAVVAAAAAH